MEADIWRFKSNTGGSVVVDFLFIVAPIVGVCNCYMFCCSLLYVHFSIAIILMGKRELVALLNLSSWCLVMVKRLFIGVPRGCLQFVIEVLPDHTHLLFLLKCIVVKIVLVLLSYMGLVTRKPVFGVSDKARYFPINKY